MIITLSLITLAFIWLGCETNWLTIRLQQYTRGIIDIGGILMMGIGMIFLAIGLLIFPGKRRANSPIPPSVYNRLVWIKTSSGKTNRQVPYYAAIKIRQRLGGDISILRLKDTLE